MQIVRMLVEHFGRIERASLALAPGLNILFGPNDLGKSTLAQAIRFALLLQDSSSAHESAVGWRSELPPRVELVFKTEPQRFWRVVKTFDSSRGASVLEESRDGESFAQVSKGRRVDEEIRKLLAWGIPVPGGRGGPRGMPDSFLATTLLARQGEVDAILMASIDNDPDDSGKHKVTRALQALAQHPLFTKVIDKTQAKVDEAFTSSGQLKRGKNDPLPQAQRRVQELYLEYEGQMRRVEETRQVVERIRELDKKRLSKGAECDALAGRLAELEKELSQGEAFQQAQERCAQAQDRLTKLDQMAMFVADLDAQQVRMQAEIRQKETQVDELRERLRLAAEDASAAREEKRDLEAGMSAQAALARKNDLQRQQIELDAREQQAGSAMKQAEDAAALEQRLAELDRELDRKRKDQAVLAQHLSESEQAENRAAAEQTLVRGLALLSARRDVLAALQKAEQNEAWVQRLRAEADSLIEKAERMETELVGRKLPSSEQLALLCRLEDDLREQEAKLGVGLAVEIRSLRPLVIDVSRDGDPVEQHSFSEAAAFEADRELSMHIASVGDIVISGGTRTAREKVRKLRARWKKEAAPLLAAAGARNTKALDEMCRDASLQAQQANALRREADALLGRRKALGDVAAALEEHRRRLAECDGELSAFDRDVLAARAAPFGDHLAREIRRLERETQQAADTARKEREECKLAIAEMGARIESLESERHRIQADLDNRSSAMVRGGWKALLAWAESDLTDARRQRAGIMAALQSEEQATAAALRAAGERMQAAERAHAAAGDACAIAQKELDTLRQSLATLRGQLEERRRAGAETDRDAAERAVDEAQAALSAHATPPTPVTETDVAKARDDFDRAQLELRELEGELYKTQGALEQVGGNVAEEQLELTKQALEQAEEQHRDTEKEYRAWRLLLETLQKAESEQASHLGKSLVEPVAARFRALTAQRYEGLSMNTELRTEGVVAAGGSRDTKALSVGTREQLATIFRLSLAERLNCAVLLDDQLVQSDAARMAWFSEVLRDAARSIQIIVLTCRPADYLHTDEIPDAAGPVVLDNHTGTVRALDLGRIIVA